MFLLTSYPTWAKVVFVIWIVFTLVVILILFSSRKKTTPVVSRSFLYEKTKQRVNDIYAKLDKEQLTPWCFFNTGKMPEVKKYYGDTIKYQGGIEFSGSAAVVFWEGFIEPFLEHGIVKILEDVGDDALANQLNPESVKRKDVTEQIEKMRNYLQRHKEAIFKKAASKYQYFLNVESRQNKNLWIAIIALGTSIMSALISLFALFKK